MGAIRDNWAKLPPTSAKPQPKDVLCEYSEPGQQVCGMPNARPSSYYAGKNVCSHLERKLIEQTSGRGIPEAARKALSSFLHKHAVGPR